MSTFPGIDSSIERLLTRNHEWADGLHRLNPATLNHLAVNGQRPEVLWIGCADSRVPESVITASMPGDIFVHRNIANQFSPDDKSAASAVQFAVQNLHVSYIFVVGHTKCGGVAAALRATVSNKPKNAVLGDWLANLTALAIKNGLDYPEDKVKLAENIAKLTQKNVENAMDQVGEFIKELRIGTDENETTAYGPTRLVTIVGLVYNLHTGRLEEVGRRIKVNVAQRDVTRGWEECSEVANDLEGVY